MVVETKPRVEQGIYPFDKFRQELGESNFGKLFLRVLENQFSNEPIEGVEIALFLGSAASVKAIIQSKGWDIDAHFTKEQAIEIALEQSTKIQDKEKYNRIWTEKEVQRGYFSGRGLTQAFMDDLSRFASHDWQKQPVVDTPTFLAIRQLGLIVVKGRASDQKKELWRKRFIGKNYTKQKPAENSDNGAIVQEEWVNLDPDCVHHWVIATPNGVYADARCKRCGSERCFVNGSDGLVAVKKGKKQRAYVIIGSKSSTEL